MASRTLLLFLLVPCLAFNGKDAELECPTDCDCHYLGVSWVTDCSGNDLTSVPFEGLSPNVYTLDISKNHITALETFPAIKLRTLHATRNELTELKRDTFRDLIYLLEAEFSSNKIGRVDVKTFEDCAGMIGLELQDNPLEPVSGPFLSSRSLMHLDISDCRLERLNDDFFTEVTALTRLDLSGNPLGSLEEKLLTPLTSLVELLLNRCKLTTIANGAFDHLENLISLELNENTLIHVNWKAVLSPIVRLEYLKVRSSNITYLERGSLGSCPYIRILDMSQNTLVRLDDVMASLGSSFDHLEALDLSDCGLEGPLSGREFSKAHKLKHLSLSGNKLKTDDLLVLEPLDRLEGLSLRNCSLVNLPETFKAFENLHQLDISYNPLRDAFTRLIKPLSMLEDLNMGYSNLSHIGADTFSSMSSMRRLVLSGNKLSALKAGLFANLTHLESLEMNHCGLSRPFDAGLFFNNLTYTDLTELEMAGNPLRVPETGPLLPKQLSRLRDLDLSACNISALPDAAFALTSNVTNLRLNNNRLSDGRLAFLEPLKELQVLDLRNNSLETLDEGVFHTHNHLATIKLASNPWRCGCWLVTLWRWAKRHPRGLFVLEGVAWSQDHVFPSGSRRKNPLLCSLPNDGPVRTWARYVRDAAACPIPNPERLMAQPNDWAPAAAKAAILYSSLFTLLLAVSLVLRFTTVSGGRTGRKLD